MGTRAAQVTRLAPCSNLESHPVHLSESASLASLSLRATPLECFNHSSTIDLKDESLNYVLKLNNATDKTRIVGYQACDAKPAANTLMVTGWMPHVAGLIQSPTRFQIPTPSISDPDGIANDGTSLGLPCIVMPFTVQQSITRMSKEMTLIYSNF